MDTDKLVELDRIKKNLSYLKEQTDRLSLAVDKMEHEISKLKPCPFCGSTNIRHTRSMNEHYVYCAPCGAKVRSGLSEDKAIEKWNTRV